jgi:hypothetical protein
MKGLSLAFALLLGAAIAASGTSCSSDHPADAPKPTFTAEDLRDPAQCKSCHIAHYDDWARSMHRYAADDPVFLAMNKRGQRETNGQLGGFCVQCHAPVALRDRKTTDGLNLASVPDAEKGVTCFFCHSIDSVGPSHVNSDVHLADDLVLRGEVSDPQANTAHASKYSPLHDSAKLESASMCGSCHDIASPAGAHIERTFQEWQGSVFSNSTTCTVNGTCHMDSDPNTHLPIALNGPTNRTLHSHDFAAIDVANDPRFPDLATQQARVEGLLGATLQGALCLTTRNGIRVLLDNVGAGHFFPSGAAQDRRVWVEVVATKNGQTIYQSGHVLPGTVVGSDPTDPDLWVLRDQMFDATGAKVDMFWQAACTGGNALTQLVPASQVSQGNFYTHRERLYPNTKNPADSALDETPDSVTLTVHVQPIGLDVLNSLVASGDLDPSIAAQAPTFVVALPNVDASGTMQTSLTWTPTGAAAAKPGAVDAYSGLPTPMQCVTTLNFNTISSPLAADPPSTCPSLGSAAVDAGP